MKYDFKVGDKVRHEFGRRGSFEISEVIKITPKGFVKVQYGNNVYVFNPDGSQRGGNTWSFHRIMPITQLDYEEIERRRLETYLMNKVSWKTLPVGRLRRILEIVTDPLTPKEKLEVRT